MIPGNQIGIEVPAKVPGGIICLCMLCQIPKTAVGRIAMQISLMIQAKAGFQQIFTLFVRIVAGFMRQCGKQGVRKFILVTIQPVAQLHCIIFDL